MSGDLQDARGQMPYEPGRCECGCLEPFHKLGDSGKRGACSNSGCGCRSYVEAAEQARGWIACCARCTVRASVGACCSSHNRHLCHACYRRTHFVEVCGATCRDCKREGLDPMTAVA